MSLTDGLSLLLGMVILSCGPEISLLAETFADLATVGMIRLVKRVYVKFFKNVNQDREIKKMISRHFKGKLNDQEYQELENWVTESEENMKCFLKLTDRIFGHKR
jgi:hypothetical protein